jgi:hypothetical protein
MKEDMDGVYSVPERDKGYIKFLSQNIEKIEITSESHRICEDNIKMDLRKYDIEIVNLINRAQDRDQWRVLLNMVMNFWVP